MAQVSLSLPPLRGKVARGVSRETDGGPSPHDKSHRQFHPAVHRIHDLKSETRECLAIETSDLVSHHARSAHPLSDLPRQARPPTALSDKRNRRNTVQAAPGAEIANPQAVCTEASTTIVSPLSSCCGAIRAHVPSTSRPPFRPPREVRGVHLPPQGGKVKKIANRVRVNLFMLSQLVAFGRSDVSFFNLPPSRGKVARGVSRVTARLRLSFGGSIQCSCPPEPWRRRNGGAS